METPGDSAGALRENQNGKLARILAGDAGRSLINKLYSCLSNDGLHQAPLHGCTILFFYPFLILLFSHSFLSLETSTCLSDFSSH